MIADEVSGWILGKCLVHGPVETTGLVDVAVQGVWLVPNSGHCGFHARSVDAAFNLLSP